jgi:4-hydroxy-3-polyprenylbenzoate decarboxylase
VAIESAFVGITGASGAPYAVRLVEILAENDVFVEVCASKMGEKVLAYEMAGMSTKKLAETYDVKRYAPDDLFAPPASGTSVPDAAVIAPASVSTLGNIANGTGTNLIHRVADVALKERKRLVVLERDNLRRSGLLQSPGDDGGPYRLRYWEGPGRDRPQRTRVGREVGP